MGPIDILDVGFSCKNFSVQNTRNRDGEFDEAISSGKGESGSTANMAFEFNTDCIDDHALFPSICFCDPWNNNIHYGKVTGSSC